MKILSNKINNKMRLEILPKSENESFARSTVCAFASQLNPTIDEINDIKTAVSEAVTNSVVHAYRSDKGLRMSADRKFDARDVIIIECELFDSSVTVTVSDNGIGIPNVDKALEPFFTTKPDEERSGMGFTVMQSFMDTLRVESTQGHGTTVTMQKFFTKEGKLASGGN
jgi:stage II sporulation protein AB (anti-sigma F factor)